jgi:hypothetical protein
MGLYNIVIIQPDNYIHAQAFMEMARLLDRSLNSLNHTSRIQFNTIEFQATNIIFGYHLLDSHEQIPSSVRYIHYQLEQLSDREGWYSEHGRHILQAADAVWDYSPDNVTFLQERGFDNVHLLPIGFHAGLESIVHQPQKDIDVLFYGSINQRRKKILEQINRHARLKTLYGVYGQERDDLIGRSRILLNIHFYEAGIMEQVRLSYLLNNRCFILSEQSEHNPYEGMIDSVAYDELTQRCLHYLQDQYGAKERERLAAQGYQRFRQRDMCQFLQRVLKSAP